jgi:FtsP/CotA-like multicopper oxidase with cupredoxin domain
MNGVTRRRLIAGAGCALLSGGIIGARRGTAGAAGPAGLPPPAPPQAGGSLSATLVAAERARSLPCFAGLTLPMWTFAPDPFPVLRMQFGQRLEATLDNRLTRPGEHTSIHWHGIRLPNDQDGVPFLVQPPVMPGERFGYSFVPPDTGTFFFHPHCNSAEQIGRGLTGVLIVEGDEVMSYAAEAVLILRDWLVDFDAGTFRNFYTSRGASRAGTFGNVRSANGFAVAVVELPSAVDCRLRLVNADPTRNMELAIDGTEAAVIAVDGIAVPPFPLDGWLLGPGARLDLAVRAPAPGRAATLHDRRTGDPVPLARLTGSGQTPPAPPGPFDPAPLRAGQIPAPRLAEAERLDFVFAQADGNRPAITPGDPLAAALIGSLCLATDDFWQINGRAWPGRDHERIPAPLAVLQRGRSYIFMLRNASRLLHPIHIHGHTFTVLRSDRRALPVHHADTVVLGPEETIEVAFVADNPGRWMFHCHVIEHQETGMMGYLEVV